MSAQQEDQVSTGHYQQAHEAWEARMGTARAQLKNWRIACLLSLVLVILLVISLWVVSGRDQTYVYVANVSPDHKVDHVRQLTTQVKPTEPQVAYFIGQFIQEIMSLSLDPVVVRRNWLTAYQKISGQAEQQLTTLARQVEPLKVVGKVTKSVLIKTFHPVGPHTYEYTWLQTVYDRQGVPLKSVLYTGAFTVSQGPLPTVPGEIIQNPFGLRIVFFNISEEGSKHAGV